MNDGDKILIQPGNGIGDLIMLTPVLRELKKKFSHCYITIMSSNSALRAIRGLSYIDDICLIKDKKEIIKKMLHQDYVVFFDYKPLLFALAKLLRIPHRIGPCKEKYKKFQICTSYFPYPEHVRGQYQSDFYLTHLCNALGLDLFHYEYKTDVFISKQAEYVVPKKKYICIAPFVRTSLPLTQDMIKNIISKLIRDYNSDIVFVGNTQSFFIEKLVRENPMHRIKSFLGKTTVEEMIAIIAHAQMAICPDSGPMHVACASGVPTIGVFSTEEMERWCEKENCYPVALHLPCQPCISGDKKRACTHHNCMNKIPFSMIEEQIDLILHKLS